MRPAGALILAAGMSTRMKGFKPLLDFHGRTMIGQVIHNFQKAGAAPIILVLGYRGDDIKDSLAGEPVIFVRNENYASSQMFDSVKIGLRKAAGVCDRVLIAPCDAPLIRPEVIRRVMESEYLMARPSFQGRPGHPVLLSCSLTEQICGDGKSGHSHGNDTGRRSRNLSGCRYAGRVSGFKKSGKSIYKPAEKRYSLFRTLLK